MATQNLLYASHRPVSETRPPAIADNMHRSHVRRDGAPDPDGRTAPRFPSLFWPPHKSTVVLDELDDMWKFTLFWTLILYGLFHLGAVGVAVLMQGGKRRSSWRYLWLVPLVYALIAGAEALVAGSVVGLMLVFPIDPGCETVFWFWGCADSGAVSARAISSGASPCRRGSPSSGDGSMC